MDVVRINTEAYSVGFLVKQSVCSDFVATIVLALLNKQGARWAGPVSAVGRGIEKAAKRKRQLGAQAKVRIRI